MENVRYPNIEVNLIGGDGTLMIYIERFGSVVKFMESGVTGLGRFKLLRKVGL